MRSKPLFPKSARAVTSKGAAAQPPQWPRPFSHGRRLTHRAGSQAVCCKNGFPSKKGHNRSPDPAHQNRTHTRWKSICRASGSAEPASLWPPRSRNVFFSTVCQTKNTATRLSVRTRRLARSAARSRYGPKPPARWSSGQAKFAILGAPYTAVKRPQRPQTIPRIAINTGHKRPCGLPTKRSPRPREHACR